MKIEAITNDIDTFVINLDAQMYGRTVRAIDLLSVYEYRLGMPYSKSLHGGLFELRISGATQVRILYCFHNGVIYLLNAFIKKTNKIPRREIELARERLKLLV